MTTTKGRVIVFIQNEKKINGFRHIFCESFKYEIQYQPCYKIRLFVILKVSFFYLAFKINLQHKKYIKFISFLYFAYLKKIMASVSEKKK